MIPLSPHHVINVQGNRLDFSAFSRNFQFYLFIFCIRLLTSIQKSTRKIEVYKYMFRFHNLK